MADLAAIQANLGGFDFQNVQRNGFLAAKGLSFGKVTYSGTPLAAELSVLKTLKFVTSSVFKSQLVDESYALELTTRQISSNCVRGIDFQLCSV